VRTLQGRALASVDIGLEDLGLKWMLNGEGNAIIRSVHSMFVSKHVMSFFYLVLYVCCLCWNAL